MKLSSDNEKQLFETSESEDGLKTRRAPVQLDSSSSPFTLTLCDHSVLLETPRNKAKNPMIVVLLNPSKRI